MFSAARRTIENAHQDVVTQKGRRSNLLCRPFDVLQYISRTQSQMRRHRRFL